MTAKILIVDDDPWILRMVTTVLQRRGHIVTTASDGQEALTRAAEAKPDLIITDVMMPKVDGWTLVRNLRAQSEFALIPVIFLTALGGDDDRIQGFRLGADDYLAKPFRFEELDLRVGNALRRREDVQRASREVRAAVPSRPPAPRGLAGAAPPPAPPQRVSFHGSIAQLGVPSVLTMLEMERKSGILVVTRTTATARLFLRQGKLLSAKLVGGGDAEQRGAEVIYTLVKWSDGSFDFTAMEVDMEDEIKSSTTHLLMEGARRMDEGG